MKASIVSVVVVHDDDEDATIVLTEFIHYAYSRGLYDGVGFGSAKLIASFPIDEDEDGVPDWDSINN